MIKRVTALTLMIFMFLIVGCEKQNSPANEKTNIVVVLDVSDSMNITDPGGGETIFTSLLMTAFNTHDVPFKADSKILKNTYFGVVTYGREAVENVPLSSLGVMDDNEYIENYIHINKIEYNDKTGTNFYAGIQKAYEMCEKNAAEKNLIYVISDGQFDFNGPEANNLEEDAETLKKYKENYKKIQDNEKYTVNAITVNTNIDSDTYDNKEYTVEHLACGGGTSKRIKEYSEFEPLAKEVYGEIAGILDLEHEWIDDDIIVNGGLAEFTLDRDYKTVHLWMLPAENKTDETIRRDTSTPPRIVSITTPDCKEKMPFEDGMETGGFLGFNKCRISVSEESGIALKAIIENAPKGEWIIELSEKSDFIIKKVEINPFPWLTVLPIITICIVLIVLLLMWLLYIPPIRYRKKAIPGFLTLEKSDGYANSTTVYEKYPVYAIAKKGKFINRGNLTLGTLLADKNYKNVIIKYCPDTDLDDAHLEVKGKDLSGNIHSFELYSDSAYIYNLNENTGFTITWSC